MKKSRQRKIRTKLNLGYEKLELKRCLASVGWDGVGQGGAELNYYLGDAPAQVGQATFESVIEQALEVWSDVVDITFTETTTPRQADSLDITFASLDGSGGVLAQAYFPDDVNRSSIAGDIQFDTAENWEVGNQQGSRAIDLLYVAVHEIGHALGLEHSDASGSVLNETVSPNQQFTGLDNADQNAALALYAPAPVVTPIAPPESVDPIAPVDPTDPVATVDPSVPTAGVDTPLVDPVDDPLEEPTEEQPTDEQPTEDPTSNEPAEPDSNQRRRWRVFRWGAVKRFRFFNFPDSSLGTQFDATDVFQTDRFSQRFTIRIFRFFR